MKYTPYRIDEPCVISFSGGRSSAYMLIQILEAHGGTLPHDHRVVFANTGKEMPETLDFVYRCERELSIPIVWLEYSGKKSFRVVDYDSASRKGEPFTQLITDKSYLPNMVARFCTVELKILTIERYMKSVGEDDYLMVVGIRGDEPRRAAKQKAKENYHCPMFDVGVTRQDVMRFWQEMPWDLQVPSPDYSNCDLCFLKGGSIKASLIRDGVSPDWWIEQEKRIGGYFRSDQPSYQAMKDYGKSQFDIFDESIPCFCGD